MRLDDMRQIHKQTREEIIMLNKSFYLTSLEIYDFLRGKCWRNKYIMSLLKEIRTLNENNYISCLQKYVTAVKNKIFWKKAQHEAEHRDRTTSGNIRWRQKGFTKQTI